MRILVTGANGSVGRGLIPALLDHGHQVIGLDKEAGVERAIAHPRFSFVRGSIEDPTTVEKALVGVEAIIHLAWSFSDNPRVLVEQDLRGHALLLEAAARQNVSHFVYASTAVAYGKPSRVPVDEDHPLNVLAARKPLRGRQGVREVGIAGRPGRHVEHGSTILVGVRGRDRRPASGEMLRTSASSLAVLADRGGAPHSGRLQSGVKHSPASGAGRGCSTSPAPM
jgi:dTDP-4-dehydrorhamnose reductase